MNSKCDQKKIERKFEFVEDTISVFKMDINPLNWNTQNIDDWFYWVRHKLRFNFPKLNKTGFDLTQSDAKFEMKWMEHFGEKAGQAMFKEFKAFLEYRDMKYQSENLSIQDRILNFVKENRYVQETLGKFEITDDLKKIENKERMEHKSMVIHKMRSYESNDSMQRRRNKKKDGLYLWQILLRLLFDDNYASIISWTDYENGNFKILNPEEVSMIWGKSKGNIKMTYDKMSRSMRQYYKSKLLIKTNRDKLNYCFNMNDASVKEFTRRCCQKMPPLKVRPPSQFSPEA